MFGKKKVGYEMVKFSENEKYRVTMLKGENGYIVFCNNIESKTIGTGGMVGMTKKEADCEYNKMCYSLSIGEMA